MLAADDIRLAEETARDLHAQGHEERARAIDAVLAVATSTLTGQPPIASRRYISTREAARALAVSHQTVRDWVARGDLALARVGTRELIPREALLAFLDGLRTSRAPERARTPEEVEAANAQSAWVIAGLPPDKVARQEALHEKVEVGHRLSRPERAEMAALEAEIADAAAARLEEWIRQTRADAT